MLDQRSLTAPCLSCEGQKGAAAKEGEDQQQIFVRQVIIMATIGINLSEHILKQCGINTEKLREVIKAEAEKGTPVHETKQIAHAIDEWRKHMQLQVRATNGVTRRFLAIKNLISFDKHGKAHEHTLTNYGLQSETEEGENVYVLEVGDKIVPLIAMPQGMNWRNIVD